MTHRRLAILAAVYIGLSAGQAQAAAITPQFDIFGPLPAATFGGTGIPNDPVAIDPFEAFVPTSGADATPFEVEGVIGLSATQRFGNPPLTDDGAGTYFATAGSNTPSGSSFAGALWNFNYYIALEEGTFSQLQFDLLYDFNPAVGNDETTHGTFNLNVQSAVEQAPGLGLDPFDPGFPAEIPGILANTQTTEGSQNLLFGFLSTPVPGYIAPPAGAFNPDAAGEYTFALVATDLAGNQVARSAIAVQVEATSAPVPAPATVGLLGLGLLLVRRLRAR